MLYRLPIRIKYKPTFLLTLNNNCTCVGWMIGHYERIDVYIELLSCSLGLTIDV